jgi:hypothetical protein
MLRWNRSGKYCSIVDADLGLEVRPDHMYMRWIMILRVESDLECPEVFDRWHRIARHKYTANKAEFQYKNGKLCRFFGLFDTHSTTSSERLGEGLVHVVRIGPQYADHRQTALLRACGKRPSGYCAGKSGQEFPPFNMDCHATYPEFSPVCAASRFSSKIQAP